jgi:hypothetical protein
LTFRYLPVLFTFFTFSFLFVGRIGHAGCGVPSISSFYIHGGRTEFADDATLDDLWCFKTNQLKWEKVDAKGEKPPPLSYHTFTNHGKYIYCFGGCTNDHGRTNGLWQLDTESNVWVLLSTPVSAYVSSDVSHHCASASSSVSDRPCGRGGPGLAAFDDSVFTGFGYNGKNELNDLYRFDLTTHKWTSVDIMGGPSARSVTDLVALSCSVGTDKSVSNKLFVFGGEWTPSVKGHEGAGEYHSDAFVMDVKTNIWTKIIVSK